MAISVDQEIERAKRAAERMQDILDGTTWGGGEPPHAFIEVRNVLLSCARALEETKKYPVASDHPKS